MRINILLLSVVMLFSINVSYADVETIDNIKVKSLISKGVPLIDIRSSNEWKETGIIEGSHLITFFNEKGKVNLNKWMSAFYKVADKTKPFMLIFRLQTVVAVRAQHIADALAVSNLTCDSAKSDSGTSLPQEPLRLIDRHSA